LVQQFKNSIPLHNENEKLTNEMDIENNQNGQNTFSPHAEAPSQNIFPTVISSQVSILSPPIKHYASVPPNKFQQ
jgi:hypothetical protein